MEWYWSPYTQIIIGAFFIFTGVLRGHRLHRSFRDFGWHSIYIVWGIFHVILAIAIAAK
ncbi:hypothetical protein IPM19_04085 [bacterium]|nr:MAG: hypothetical protein IPM19_04085 [bacterium]